MWRFGKEKNSLWKRLICAKYGIPQSILWWNWKHSSSVSYFVQAVGSLLEDGSNSGAVFKEGWRVIIGNGNRARFWDDLVWDSTPLKLAFPRIYVLSVFKKGLVQEFGSWVGSTWTWKIPLRRRLFD